MTYAELKHKFLLNRDETGRFIVYSPRTHISYFVEVLEEGERRAWGDLDPITKAPTGDYGKKYTGAIAKEESLITPENGFINIATLEPGYSPAGYIDMIDDLRYAEQQSRLVTA